MKMMMKKYMVMAATCLMAVSCIDTVILPDDKTVDEDFWKTKGDVQLMTGGAYRSMLAADVVRRLIVWGDLRSDELLPVASVPTNQAVLEDLVEINTGNTQYDNQFATWSAFYAVINNCNLVLAKAGAVVSEDPSYTEGDYLADRSQMLALRALCYFYLVRAYRDVPYTTEAFMNSSQNMNIPQSDPESVLLACIADLEEAEPNAISPLAFNDWRRTGYFNRDGINALLADIYLWLGSAERNASYCQKAVDYCDRVIESKKEQRRLARRGTLAAEADDDGYPLAEGRNAFNELFVTQNAEESIFELQFNGSNSNTGVCEMLNMYANNRDRSYLVAPVMFAKGNTVYKTTGTSDNDYRALMNTYRGSGDELGVRKMVAQNLWLVNSAGGDAEAAATRRAYNNYDQNYIIYRLTDVMLMKAEALMAQAAGSTDSIGKAADAVCLRQAFNLVQAVNLRSKEQPGDSMRWNTYSSGVQAVEELILAERLRELAFEGKRWYDLLRYNYRRAGGTVNYNKTLADIKAEGGAFMPTYALMLALMARKLGAQGSAVAAKLNTEPALYMPVPKNDLEVCDALRQNPAYGTVGNYEKNY